MGASNALRVYQTWGRPHDGRPALTNRSLRLLAYMALRSRDGDPEPWYGAGHRELAILGLGLDIPDDPAKADMVLRKVRRFIQSLHEAGAIETVRRATYGVRGEVPAKYRLYLDGPAAPRPAPLPKLGITARSALPGAELVELGGGERDAAAAAGPGAAFCCYPISASAGSASAHRSLSDRSPQVTF